MAKGIDGTVAGIIKLVAHAYVAIHVITATLVVTAHASPMTKGCECRTHTCPPNGGACKPKAGGS